MTPELAIKFLTDLELYFQQLTIFTKEDSVYWAHVSNALNCKKIADMIKIELLK